MKVKLHHFAFLSVLLVGIVSCIKIIHEPDVWWQIRTGQWIIENKIVPKTDVFSFTFSGEPWINVKWIAEVLMAFVADSFGVEWIILLQVFCTLTILLFCYKLTVHFNFKLKLSKTKIPKYGILIFSLIMLFVINFRMNSRPEMFSHLFMIVYLYYLFKHSRSGKHWIYILIPLQILWTNTHEAYGMGIILILIFIFSLWIEHFYFKKEKPIQLTIAGILAILCSAINPNGVKMILHPFNIFGQLHQNKFTIELFDFKMPDYWHYQAYFMLLFFVIGLVFFIKKRNPKLKRINNIVNSFGLSYFIVFVSLFYLSLTAFRNIPFFIIASTPLLACYIDSKFAKTQPKGYYTIIGISIISYGLIASNLFYNAFLPSEKYGIDVNSQKTPIGAGAFLKNNNIKGNGFVDFLSSSFLLYDLQPDYKSYIDLRDLDVFTIPFFENVFMTYQYPSRLIKGGSTLWEYINTIDTLNYVVLLNNTNFHNLNNYLIHKVKNYELVYADGLNSVYLKVNSQNKEAINKFGLTNGEKDVFHDYSIYKTSKSAKVVSKLFWPFKTVEKQIKMINYKTIYYRTMGISIF